MEAKTAQLRVRRRCIIAEGAGGSIFWATPTRARQLIAAGAVDLVNAGPSEQPVVGPSETKPAGPLEKKSSAADPAFPSTDSAKSSEAGTVQSSFLSQADRVSQPKTSRGSRRGAGKADGGT